MKNLKVSMKLIVSFIIVIVMAIGVGVVGIIGMSQINSADDALYNSNLLAISYIGQIRAEYNIQRAAIRDLAIYPAEYPNFQSALDEIKSSEAKVDEMLALYDATIERDDDRALFNTFLKAYREDFAALKREVTEHGRNDDTVGAMEILMTKGAAAQQIIRPTLNSCMELNQEMGKESVDNNTKLFNTMTIVEIAVLAFAVVVAMFFALYISNLISKPLGILTNFMKKAGSTGNIIIGREEQESISKFGEAKDEVGQCIKYTASFVKHITNISEELEAIAGGDLSVDAQLLSQQDTMGLSLQKMVGNLNNMFSEINNSTAQVSNGSKQIADGAQALAQGSTQQAAAVEELSASITEVAGKTKENADMANKAANLAQTIKGNAEKGSQQMDTMMSAVKEINEASQSINRVIKVIDDIAFQTNILALNAAVEAARAGQHGKGFAVVAEEVRSLAAKSAEAAKDTGALIANSMEKAELGARIADETAASLVDIVSGINESTLIVGEIAASSEQQTLAINQINNGIDQVAQVVQQNSATAEESAAASEEMSGQANMLEELISQFKLKDSNRKVISSPAPARKQLAMPEKTSYKPNDGSDFGKY